MDLLISLVALVPLILFLILNKIGSRKVDHRSPPGPRGLPLIGILHQFDEASPHKYFLKLSQKYGPMVSFKLGSMPFLVVSSAKLAKEVMGKQDLVFCSRPPMTGLHKLSYDGLDVSFSEYGATWREVRKISVLHLLNTKRVQSYRPVREDEVSRMLEKIASSKVANLSEIVRFTLTTVICRIAFGKRYDEQDQERRRFCKLMHDTQAAFVKFYFSDFFPGAIGRVMDRLVGSLSALDQVFRECDSFYQELIEEHMDPNRPNSMDGDIVDILLQIRREKSSAIDITDDHIKATLMNVFTAGADSTTATIIWAMTALVRNPKIMAKGKAEIREVTGKEKHTLINEDDVAKLPYLRAIVKETLRAYPPGPVLVPRYSMEDCVLDGYKIPSNTTVYVNGWAIARDPEYWEKPEEFIPERFLDAADGNQDYWYIPFGGGRRICPGNIMATETVELVLANLMHSFDWELPSGMKEEDIDYQTLPGLTMSKKIPLLLVPKRR